MGYICRLYAVMQNLDQEMLCHERVGSWMVVNTWWYERGCSYPDTLVWGYEREGSYVPCSHLRDIASREVRTCWSTCVGLRARRFVEAGLRVGRFIETGPRAGRFVGASYILNPWSIICVNGRLKILEVLRSWPRTN